MLLAYSIMEIYLLPYIFVSFNFTGFNIFSFEFHSFLFLNFVSITFIFYILVDRFDFIFLFLGSISLFSFLPLSFFLYLSFICIFYLKLCFVMSPRMYLFDKVESIDRSTCSSLILVLFTNTHFSSSIFRLKIIEFCLFA